MKRILFIDRDGVILREPPRDFQVDGTDKTSFVPGAIVGLSNIAASLDYYKVMVTNQDGLGTSSYPADTFYPYQNLMLRTLEGEGFTFDEVIIDTTFAHENAPTRKPGTGLLTHLINNPAYDLSNSFVIGDRYTDIQLAKNLGCKAIYFKSPLHPLTPEQDAELRSTIALETSNWEDVYSFLKLGIRKVSHARNTNETKIQVELNLSGSGIAEIHTGLGFFDTIEDTGLALGEAFALALADKRGMERYGFALPMDEAEAKVLIDFGGRNWLVWDASFKREKIGEMPTEMFFHFFKSFSDAAKCNLNISCAGDNEHHKIEAIFKAFAKAIKMAVKRDPFSSHLPSTKGVL